VVEVLRAIAECTEKHRLEQLRQFFMQKGLPSEAYEKFEPKFVELSRAGIEAGEALLARYESGEIDLDEYRRLSLTLAAESGAQMGPGIFDEMAKLMGEER
jgi:hypothetical protein